MIDDCGCGDGDCEYSVLPPRADLTLEELVFYMSVLSALLTALLMTG